MFILSQNFWSNKEILLVRLSKLMELFSKRGLRLKSTQLSNKFGFVLHELFLLFWHLPNTYKPSSPVSCRAPLPARSTL